MLNQWESSLAARLGLAAGFPLAFVYAWGIIQIDEQKMAAIATLVYGPPWGPLPRTR